NGAIQVTATVTATGGQTGAATRVMLVLDRSGSIAGGASTTQIAAAKAVIEKLDAADGAAGGTIRHRHSRGIEIYQGSRPSSGPGVAPPEAALDALTERNTGSPHAAGISAAQTALGTTGGRGIVLITDGQVDGSDTSAADAATAA